MKSLNKLTAVLAFAVVFIMNTCLYTMAEDTAGCKNVLSDTVYDFSYSGGVGSYFQVNNGNNPEHYGDNAVEIVTEDGKSCASFNHVPIGDGTGKDMVALPYNRAAQSGAALSQWEIAFSLKRTDADTVPFYFGTRKYGEASFLSSMLSFANGKVKVFAKEITSYSLDTWYDVKFTFDMAQRNYILDFKETDDGEWSRYTGSYSSVLLTNGGSATSTTADITGIGYYSPNTTAQKTFLTNFMQNTGEELFPTFNDDFEKNDFSTYKATANVHTNSSLEITLISDRVLDSRNGWLVQNFAAHTIPSHEDIDGDGDKEFVLTSDDSAAGYPSILREPFYDYTDVWHRIRFKMGNSGHNDAIGYFTVKIKKADGSLEDKVPVRVRTNTVYAGDVTYNRTDTTEGTMYDFEVTYKTNDTKIYVSFWDENGVQYVSSMNCSAGNLSRIDFYNKRDSAVAAKMYIDDFAWEVLPAPTVPTAAVKSGTKENASLDERVIFTFGETLNNEKTPQEAVVTVRNSAGEVIDTPYDIYTEREKAYVCFSDLKPNQTYRVELSNVQTLSGQETETGEAQFTTMNQAAISATTPVISGDNLIATATSPYAEGRQMLLIAMLFDDSGVLTESLTKQGIAVRNETNNISLDLSGFSQSGTVKAFVWSDFNKMIYYSAPTTGSYTK